jgi:hypothetical protein
MSEATEITTYTNRSNAARAARVALGGDKISGVHFRVTEIDADKFAWEVLAQDAPAAPEDPAADAPTAAPQADAPKAKAAKPAKTAKAKGERKIADNGDGLPKGKLGQVIGMMQRPEGATNAQMQAATGWQPHTVRGAIAGAIKVKLGLSVTAEKTDAGLVYRIAKVAA